MVGEDTNQGGGFKVEGWGFLHGRDACLLGLNDHMKDSRLKVQVTPP